MKVMVISIFLAILPFASALDLSFDFQQSISLNESFPVKISAATSEVYDVKIIIQDNSTKATISEIYNDGWKNPYYYVKSAFPEKSEFSVRAVAYSDNAQICVRLRKTGASSFTEKCSGIEIIQSASPAEDKLEEEGGGEEEAGEESAENKTIEIPAEDFTPSENSSPEEQPQNLNAMPDYDNKKIVLIPKSSEKSMDFVTKEEKMRLVAVYAFSFFAVCIIILLALKKL